MPNNILDGVPPIQVPGLSPFGPPGSIITPGNLPIPPGWQFQQGLGNRFSPNFDAFSRPEFMSPAQAGIAAAQFPPVFPADTRGGALGNQLAGMALGALTGNESIAQGMYPWQGTGDIGAYDWFRSRNRGMEAEKILRGSPGSPGLYAINPELNLMGAFGAMPPVQGFFGGDIRDAFSTGFGQLGTHFSGGLREQGENVARFVSAMAGGFTRGNRLDDILMFGAGLPETVGNVAAAANSGYFGFRGAAMQDISSAVATGSPAWQNMARETARDMGRGVNEFAAVGREVFGGNASIQDIFAGTSQIMDMRGMSAGEATSRLREVDALSETLNIDSQALVKYIAAMRKMSENAGLYGTSAVDAANSTLLGAESTIRAGADKGVGASRESLIRNRMEVVGEDLTSMNARTNQAMQFVLNQIPEETLAGTRMKDGRTVLQGRNRMQGIIDRMADETDPAKIASMQRELESTYSNLPSQWKARIGQEVHYGDPAAQQAAMKLMGLKSYNESAAESVTQETLRTVGSSMKEVERTFAGNAGYSAMSKRLGGIDGILKSMGEAGILTAAMGVQEGGGVEEYNRVVSKFARENGISSRDVTNIVTSLTTAVGTSGVADPATGRVQSGSKSVFRLMEYAGVGRDGREKIRDEMDTENVSKQIFTAMAGNAYRGNQTMAGLMRKTILKTLDDPEAQKAAQEGRFGDVVSMMKDNAPKEFIDELSRGGRATNIRDALSGKEFNGRSIYTLRDQVLALKKKHGENYGEYTRERDALVGSFIEDVGGPKATGGEDPVARAVGVVGQSVGAKSGGDVDLGGKTIEAFGSEMKKAFSETFREFMGERTGGPMSPPGAEKIEGR